MDPGGRNADRVPAADSVASVSVADLEARLLRLESLMEEQSVGAVLLSLGADLPYFTGYEAMPLERLTMLVVTRGREPVLVVPELEAPRVKTGPFSLHPWGETEDPLDHVARLLDGVSCIAVGDQLWATFLLGLQSRLPDVAWTTASDLTRELRMVKDPDEIAALRAAAAAVDRVLERLPHEIRFSGRSEVDVARDVTRMTVEEGHDQALFWIVASGPNSASPHHEPGRRVVRKGDVVVVDFGGRMGGYCSDVTRTFSVGEPDPQVTEVHEVVRAANEAARAAVTPGVAAEEVDAAARKVIEDAGLGRFFIHRTGHGIGMEVHEHPYIVAGNSLTLKEGMAFSVEPGVYLPDRFGVRIEDIVVVGTDGAVELNRAERELSIVE